MYKVKSVESATDMKMDPGKNWYRYVIANEYNTITGIRSGTMAEVSKHARLCAAILNAKYKSGKAKIYKPMHYDAPLFA